MNAFVIGVTVIYMLALVSIVAWVVKKNAESDAKYERDLDEIYGRKR